MSMCSIRFYILNFAVIWFLDDILSPDALLQLFVL